MRPAAILLLLGLIWESRIPHSESRRGELGGNVSSGIRDSGSGIRLATHNLIAAQDSRIRELIDRLLDEEIGVRQKAAEQLAEFGAAAVPALEGLTGSPDLELRARAASILKSISENKVLSRHWRRGPRITLDFENSPAARVLEELARQGGDAFKFDAAAFQDPLRLKVKDSSFWDALDALCRAAPALGWDVAGDALSFTGKRRPDFPSKRQDEFNVWVEGVRFSREYDFTGNPRSMFILDLASAWESGVNPAGVEQKISEILDDAGAAILLPEALSYGNWLEVPKARIQRGAFYVPLPRGAKEIRKFARVRGTSTFHFPKSYQDLSIDLRSTPAPLTSDRITVVVRNFRVLKDSCSIEVVVSSPIGPGEPPVDRLPLGEIALVDDQGGLHRVRSLSRRRASSDSSITVLDTVEASLPEGRTVVSLNLRVLKDLVEKRVAFEFNDIPAE